MDEIEQTTIGVLEGVDLPLFALRAALTCASTEETRYYLNGVYVQAIGDEYRIVATDGHRLFVYSTPVESERKGAEVPAWMTKGVIVSAEGLKERLTLLDKLDCETARIAYQVDSPYVVISDAPGHATTFKVKPVDGTFPEYQKILDTMSFEARELGEMASVSFDTGYLKDVGMLAKMLGAKAARVFGNGATDPSLITFPECPFAVLVLMPLRVSADVKLGAGVARVMIGAVNSTISALRAHQTRWANKIEGAKGNAKKAAENKVAEYDQRIAAIIAASSTVQALPAPEPERVQEVDGEDGEVSYAIAGAVVGAKSVWDAQVAALPDKVKLGKHSVDTSTLGESAQAQIVAAGLADYRKGLKPADGKRARARFYADVNAALEGVSLSQLADGVPIDDWYDAGLEPAEAAKRCGDWRRIGDVLPADEVGPGEADLPVGLLQSEARVRTTETITNVETGETFSVTVHQPAETLVDDNPDHPDYSDQQREVEAARNPEPTLDAEFEAFKAQVSAIIQERKGVALEDLVDCPIRDWFDKGVSTKSAASKAIRLQNNS